MNHKRIIIICGHYGCGKTNLSINLAVDFTNSGEDVILVDMDIVNPYFRSSDYTVQLQAQGIQMLSPIYAGTNLDAPALTPAIASVFESDKTVIFDVGGDDAGATALGRYFRNFSSVDYDMFYVINRYRSLTTTAGEASELLGEIESASRLRATAVVNNSHLKQLTNAKTIMDSVDFARDVSERLQLPLLFTTAPREIAPDLKIENIYPVDMYVRTPWE